MAYRPVGTLSAGGDDLDLVAAGGLGDGEDLLRRQRIFQQID
jgi:hypothetical protein